jgi:hypothetical protein
VYDDCLYDALRVPEDYGGGQKLSGTHIFDVTSQQKLRKNK